MNTYDRFLSSLLSEFKRKAQPQVRSLWADLMELEEAIDEPAFAAAREQALHRIRVLGRVANSANAHPVRSLSQSLKLTLGGLMQTRAATRPELFTRLHETLWMLAATLYSIDADAPVSEHARQPDELTLVESCAD
jgi:hypothetical protein